MNKESGVNDTERDRTRAQLGAIVRAATLMSADLGEEIERLLEVGRQRPLSGREARTILTKAVKTMKGSAVRRGDERTLAALSGDVEEVVDRLLAAVGRDGGDPLPLPRRAPSRNPMGRERVVPDPVFHGRRVAMYRVRVAVRDLNLWAENERLEIHLEQFRATEGRDPTDDELLAIMQSRVRLPGIDEEDADDQFEIQGLADSIAKNGVRQPPILDQHGTLLDGNRRVAACYYILNSGKRYSSEEKARAEFVYAWQMDDNADDEDRQAVIVALNFEEDHKLRWPEYVKARKVAQRFERIRSLYGRLADDRKIKQEVAGEFALDTTTVSRYLYMVAWASDFEEYHTGDRGRDSHAVQHRANRYFQYFKELSDGRREGGVAWTLDQDPDYKHLVFDLLFDGKFKKWEQIRMLKHRDDQLDRDLAAVAKEPDAKIAQRDLDIALGDVQKRNADKRRTVGVNEQVASFARLLAKLSIEEIHEQVTPENLQVLVEVCDRVAVQVKKALEEKRQARGASVDREELA
jgi:hypothetical protein